MKKLVIVTLLLILTTEIQLFAQEQTSKYTITEKGIVKKIYTGDTLTKELLVFAPEVVFKGKYEFNTESSESRFTVRNSRLGIVGNLSQMISYKFMLELSSEGKFNVLDLYARFKP